MNVSVEIKKLYLYLFLVTISLETGEIFMHWLCLRPFVLVSCFSFPNKISFMNFLYTKDSISEQHKRLNGWLWYAVYAVKNGILFIPD